MPVTCLVVGCGSRANRDNLGFYNVPSLLNHKFQTHKNELAERRRKLWVLNNYQLWLSAINRHDLTEAKIKNQRVCSKHFITGKPAALEDETDLDWIPSQYMGQLSSAVSKRPTAIDRVKRHANRVESNTHEEHVPECFGNLPEDTDERPTGVSIPATLARPDMFLYEDHSYFAEKQIEPSHFPFDLMNDQTNTEKWKYFTGFTYEFVQNIILPEIEAYMTHSRDTPLSKFNQLILALIKLHLDLDFKLLGYSFKILPTTASTYFEQVIHILHHVFKPLIIWPEQSWSQKNVPQCFKKVFRRNTTVILDCFEIFIEKPSSLETQQRCWSNNKCHETVKYLIGITPQGTISYISDAWGGRTSDEQMVELTDFCDNIKPGNIVLADRGFLIKDAQEISQDKRIMPAFTKGNIKQLHPLKIGDSRHMADVRIHVERIIEYTKNKFKILKSTIPISMIKKGQEEFADQESMLDKIIVICCALINLSPPIIPL